MSGVDQFVHLAVTSSPTLNAWSSAIILFTVAPRFSRAPRSADIGLDTVIGLGRSPRASPWRRLEFLDALVSRPLFLVRWLVLVVQVAQDGAAQPCTSTEISRPARVLRQAFILRPGRGCSKAARPQTREREAEDDQNANPVKRLGSLRQIIRFACVLEGAAR